tara:strand:+ start:3313 stop:3525 length:213 start_codon:yes stop_codon:yes gene_type:complete
MKGKSRRPKYTYEVTVIEEYTRTYRVGGDDEDHAYKRLEKRIRGNQGYMLRVKKYLGDIHHIHSEEIFND